MVYGSMGRGVFHLQLRKSFISRDLENLFKRFFTYVQILPFRTLLKENYFQNFLLRSKLGTQKDGTTSLPLTRRVFENIKLKKYQLNDLLLTWNFARTLIVTGPKIWKILTKIASLLMELWRHKSEKMTYFSSFLP